ncbi:hypothetical protein BB560_004968, partial [Smittium megazygosporum]
ARDILTGRKIDQDSNCVIKAELAKKNLYTKRNSLNLNIGSFGMELTGSAPYYTRLGVNGMGLANSGAMPSRSLAGKWIHPAAMAGNPNIDTSFLPLRGYNLGLGQGYKRGSGAGPYASELGLYNSGVYLNGNGQVLGGTRGGINQYSPYGIHDYGDSGQLLSAPIIRPVDLMNTQSENLFISNRMQASPQAQQNGMQNFPENEQGVNTDNMDAVSQSASTIPGSNKLDVTQGLLGLSLSPESQQIPNMMYMDSVDLMRAQSERKYDLSGRFVKKNEEFPSLSSHIKSMDKTDGLSVNEFNGTNASQDMMSIDQLSGQSLVQDDLKASSKGAVPMRLSTTQYQQPSFQKTKNSSQIPPGLSKMEKSKSSTGGYGLNDQNPPCNTLYVGNLAAGTMESELRALFEVVPGYKRMCFRTKPNSGPMCFVEFIDILHATKAMNSLNGTRISTSSTSGIRLSYSKNPLGVRSSQNPNSAQASLSSRETNGLMGDQSQQIGRKQGNKLGNSITLAPETEVEKSSAFRASPVSFTRDSGEDSVSDKIGSEKLNGFSSGSRVASDSPKDNQDDYEIQHKMSIGSDDNAVNSSTSFISDYNIPSKELAQSTNIYGRDRPTSNGTLVEQRRSFDYSRAANPEVL